MAQRPLDGRLRQIVGIVLIARQGAREAAQPRQQCDDVFTDFLHDDVHAFMTIIRRSGGFSSMRKWAVVFLWMTCLAVGVTRAQLVPQVQLPPVSPVKVPAISLPGTGVSPNLRDLAGARLLRIETLSREHRAELDRDPRGELVIRAEVVGIDVTEDALKRALADDFLLKRTQTLPDLGVTISVLQTPQGWSAG